MASISNDHPSNDYPVGETSVKWTVTDNSGNKAFCVQKVTVTDNEKPVITCPDAVTTVTDPAVSYATILLNQPDVTDNCGVQQVGNDQRAGHGQRQRLEKCAGNARQERQRQ